MVERELGPFLTQRAEVQVGECPSSSRVHPRSRLLVRLTATLDGVCQRLAALIHRLAALPGYLGGALAPFACSLTEVLPRLPAARRRVQHGHRRSADPAQ